MAIRIETTNKELSVNGGLLVFQEFQKSLSFGHLLETSLPQTKYVKDSSLIKFQNLVLGFVAGADCLDDMDRLNQDTAFKELCKETYAAKSYGDFLRAFDSLHCKNLSYRLIDLAYKLRGALYPKQDTFVIDIA